MRLGLGYALAIGVAVAEPVLAETVTCRFTPDGWSPADWVMVKSPRFAHFGGWVQRDDHLQNEVPADATPAEWQGKRAGETYTSMVYGRRVAGNARITTTIAFTPQMAPLIVLAPELGRDAAGRPEYREHWEAVAFNQGANIWHHRWADGKASWTLAAYARFPLQPDTKYLFELEVKNRQLIVRLAGHEFGYRDESLPAEYHLGLTGCEGLNRFYDVTITGELQPAE